MDHRSRFARLVSQQRPHWVTASIGALLVLAALAAATLDGLLADLFGAGYWRLLLLPPAVISYILFVSPILRRMGDEATAAFRAIVLIDDEKFDQLVKEGSQIKPAGEWAAIIAGAAFGLWVGYQWFAQDDVLWLKLYAPLAVGMMFGLLTWTIHVSLAGTRVIAELVRQPLQIDIFDLRPFEPIGRESLTAALVFVGGIALGIFFSYVQGNALVWQNWLVYTLLLAVPVAIFFLSMRDTHRVLAEEKGQQLAVVQQQIVQTCRTLVARIEANEDTGTLAARVNALTAYEARLQSTRTWPYNTDMLRTLFFSFVLPGAAALAQLAIEMLLG